MKERQIIDLIRNLVEEDDPDVVVPLGDDAACIRHEGELLLTVDCFYEGVHFDTGFFEASDIGWKCAAATLSDIAAMGGRPLYSLLSLGFSSEPDATVVRELMEGFNSMVGSYSCRLVGGDVCRTMSGLGLCVTCIGEAPRGGGIRRGGAAEGDLVGVTGCLGDSVAGLHLLTEGTPEQIERYEGLARAHLRPVPMIEAGMVLAESGVSAMEDVSDGLAADMQNICRSSGLGCRLDAAAIPVSDELARFAGEFECNALGWAVSGGEDYQLLFTAGAERFEAAARALSSTGDEVHRIGVMTREERMYVAAAGEQVIDLEGLGYEHFA